MKNLRQYLGILVAGLLLFFFIKPFMQTHTQLKDVTLQIQWQLLIPAFVVLLLYRSLYTYPFSKLLSGIAQKRVTFQTAFTLFHLANITRYLPGRIWGVVRMLSLSQRFGLSKTAVGSSLTLHVGIETALGGLVVMSLLFSKAIREIAQDVLENISGHALLLTLAVIGIMAGVLFCIPKVSIHMARFLKTLVPLLANSHLWVSVLASHAMLWICQGLAFCLFVKSIAPVPWKDAGVLTAYYAFAWIVGFLSFLTPGGLGIREGLLGLLLANYMPAPKATLVALIARVWMLSVEIILAGIAFCIRQQNAVPQPLFKEEL